MLSHPLIPVTTLPKIHPGASKQRARLLTVANGRCKRSSPGVRPTTISLTHKPKSFTPIMYHSELNSHFPLFWTQLDTISRLDKLLFISSLVNLQHTNLNTLAEPTSKRYFLFIFIKLKRYFLQQRETILMKFMWTEYMV